ncbi:MAG: hypothetical protein AAF709_15930 [Pseudomonadota bacterium]
MKDRRGTAMQGYVDQSDDSDFLKPNEGYSSPQPEAEELGSAPKPAKTALTEEAAPEEAAAGPLKGPSAEAESLAKGSAAEDATGAGDDGAGNDIGSAVGQGAAAAIPTTAQPDAVDAGVGVTPAAYGGGAAGGGGTGEGSGFLGDAMGWDMAAFAEAGGYEAILTGQLPPGAYGDGDGQDIFVFIEELDLDIVNNTLIQNTEINLIADDGSVIDIGGDFNAIQTQESLVIDGSSGPALPPPDAGGLPGEGPVIEADAGMAY